MRKTYLLLYSDAVGNRARLKRWADNSPLVATWRYDLPHSFYLVSEASAAELSQELRKVIGKKGRFLITELSENRQGWLPADTWHFIRHKRSRTHKDAL